MPPVINRNLCIKCTLCAQICPLDVIHIGDNHEIEVDYPDECWHCRACAIECPKQAITMHYPLSHMMLTMPVPQKEGE